MKGRLADKAKMINMNSGVTDTWIWKSTGGRENRAVKLQKTFS